MEEIVEIPTVEREIPSVRRNSSKRSSVHIDNELGSREPRQNFGRNVSAYFNSDISLQKLDIDGDGKISKEELRKHIADFERQEYQNKGYKKVILIMAALFIVLSVMIGLLTYGAIEISKESNIKGDVMISKETGDAVQCANTDLSVDRNGNLVARSSVSSGSRRLAEDGSDADVLGVRRTLKKKELASTLPFKYFKEIEWLEIESDTG